MRVADNAPVLKLPYRGAPQTVALLKRSALESQSDYSVRRLAEHICEGLPSKDYRGEYIAIYRFVLSRVRYMRDPRTVELVRAPYLVAQQILAGQTPSLDCDDMTALICALVLAVGGKCQICTVAFRDMHYKGQRQYSHVFAMAWDPQTMEWIILDPVAGHKTAKMRSEVKAAAFWPVA